MAITTSPQKQMNINTATLTVPGPQPWPVLGAFGNLIPFFMDPIGVSNKLFRQYGDKFALVTGGGTRLFSPLPSVPVTIFTRKPADLHQLIQNETFQMYGPSGIFFPLGETPRKQALNRWAAGLWGVRGDEHRDHRRLLMPAFHKKRIESYRDDMVRLTYDSMTSWQLNVPDNTFVQMMNLARRIATKTLFGQETQNEENSVANKIEESYAIYSNPLTVFFQHDWPGTRYHRFLNLVWEIDDTLREMTVQKRKQANEAPDVISMLLTAMDETGSGLTEDDVVSHMFLIYAGAHETISSVLSWTLLLLSQNPQIHANLLDELQSVLKGDAPTVEQLSKLPYLERVVKESLRILPPAPLKPRVAMQDTNLDDYFIPAGPRSSQASTRFTMTRMFTLIPKPTIQIAGRPSIRRLTNITHSALACGCVLVSHLP